MKNRFVTNQFFAFTLIFSFYKSTGKFIIIYQRLNFSLLDKETAFD